MKLTRTNVVFSRTAMMLFLCRNKSSRNDLKIHGDNFWKYKKYWRKNQGQGAYTLSTRVGARPLSLWSPWTSIDLNSNSICSCSGRKKSERRTHGVLRYGAAATSCSSSGGQIWSSFGAPKRKGDSSWLKSMPNLADTMLRLSHLSARPSVQAFIG